MPRFHTISELREFLELNSSGMARDTLKHAAESREKRQARDRTVQEAIRSQWNDGLDGIDAAIFAMGQHGIFMLDRLDEVDQTAPDDAHQIVRVVLALLHFNALITLQEIRVLLEAGFWSGGAARWRALHEAAVTALLITKGDAALAQRYLDHGHVVQTRRLKAYYDEHGVGPVDPTELEDRLAQAITLEAEHSLSNANYRFRDAYGWALPLMPINSKGNRVRPTMDELEKLAGLDHRRLLVATSHGVVHGDSGGITGTVLLGDGQWLAGPTERFVETVARPTLDTLVHLVGATHLGFEPELNDAAEMLALFASGLMSLCGSAVHSFDRHNA
jgi:hypothetical protein